MTHRRRALLAVVVLGALAIAGACSSAGGDAEVGAGPPCPVEPVDVVVTVEQWSDLVSALGGSCARVTTVLRDGDVDPHEFEPSPADRAAFERADLVVLNGAGYDEWADLTLDTVSPRPAVVDAAEVVGVDAGDDPHVWYDPTAVQQVGDAVTDELTRLEPDAASALEDRADEWRSALVPFLEQVSRTATAVGGRRYAATEPVADRLASALGLVDVTPDGYRRAAINESEPSPGDVNAFEELLRSGDVDVLVVNTQTEGALTDQLRSVAEGAGVPVVEVTETPPGDRSFVEWQLDQLRDLGEALGA